MVPKGCTEGTRSVSEAGCFLPAIPRYERRGVEEGHRKVLTSIYRLTMSPLSSSLFHHMMVMSPMIYVCRFPTFLPPLHQKDRSKPLAPH